MSGVAERSAAEEGVAGLLEVVSASYQSGVRFIAGQRGQGSGTGGARQGDVNRVALQRELAARVAGQRDGVDGRDGLREAAVAIEREPCGLESQVAEARFGDIQDRVGLIPEEFFLQSERRG